MINFNNSFNYLIFFVVEVLMGKIFGVLRMRTAEKTDERVRNMSEIISGIRVIKMFAWEELFEKMMNLCRKYRPLAHFLFQFKILLNCVLL